MNICHVPPGNPDNYHTITVSVNAIDAHLAHGDFLGSCNELCDSICNDGNACTIDHYGNCEEEGCAPIPRAAVDCDDSNPCTVDSCDSATGCINTPIACDDGDLCTTDVCVDGDCEYTPVVCPEGELCAPDTGECEPISGESANFFFTAAKDTGPVITATTSAVSAITIQSAIIINAVTWDWGNPMYELFNTLRDYVDELHEGIIGVENIYRVSHLASSCYSRGALLVESITPQVIDSPFDLGNTVTYDQAVNDTTDGKGYAMRVDGLTRYALLTVSHFLADSDEYTVMQGSYNESTGALELNMVPYIDYENQMDFSARLELVGNERTHEFTLRFLKYSDGGYWISVVGKGVSQGEGNYFLFKVSDNENITDRYFCFPASANEDTLRAMDDTGSDIVAPDCSSYQSDVDSLMPFESSDVPTAASDFNTGGTGTAAEGTIYLDIQ